MEDRNIILTKPPDMVLLLSFSDSNYSEICHKGPLNSRQNTFKVPITTAADDKVYDIFPNFLKKEGMRKYHALFVIFEKAVNFDIVVCRKL